IGTFLIVFILSFIYQELALLNEQQGSKRNLFIYFMLAGLFPFLHLQAWTYFVGILMILLSVLMICGKAQLRNLVLIGISMFLLISVSLISLKLPFYQECLNNLGEYCFNRDIVKEYHGLFFFDLTYLFKRSIFIILILTGYLFYL